VEEVVPIPVEVGDVVLYSRYSGVDIRLGGEDATIMSADDMLFVLAPEQAREFLQVA
jgi:co-chaperonin GroES (HSP10)